MQQLEALVDGMADDILMDILLRNSFGRIRIIRALVNGNAVENILLGQSSRRSDHGIADIDRQLGLGIRADFLPSRFPDRPREAACHGQLLPAAVGDDLGLAVQDVAEDDADGRVVDVVFFAWGHGLEPFIIDRNGNTLSCWQEALHEVRCSWGRLPTLQPVEA